MKAGKRKETKKFKIKLQEFPTANEPVSEWADTTNLQLRGAVTFLQ